MLAYLSTFLVLTPLVGAVVVALLPDDADELAHHAAIAVAALVCLLAGVAAFAWDPAERGAQFLEVRTLSEALEAQWAVGIDGVSLPLVVLTSVLFLAAVLGSGEVRPHLRSYLAWMLALEAPVLGVFVAQDWTLFYACWELTLLPLFFLINRWGGEHRERATLTFLLYTMAGSVFLLNAILVLLLLGPGREAFPAGGSAAALPIGVQLALLTGLIVGFAVKVPLVPLHGWLPLAHVEAPAPVSVLLSGILLKMGAYGLIRAVQALPDAAHRVSTVLWVAGTVGIVHGALLAWRSRDLKVIVAWSSVSHMGFVVVGIATLGTAGLQGAILQIVAHGLVAGLLFLMVGALYSRAHTRDLDAIGGIAHRAPWLAGALAFGLLASAALPGTAGFPAELMILAGTWQSFGGWVVLPLLGAVLWSATAVRAALLLLTGARTAVGEHLEDLHPAELAAGLLLVGGLVAVGLAPRLVEDVSHGAIHDLVAHLTQAPMQEVADALP